MPCRPLDEKALEEGFLDKFDHIILDLDGVLWIGRNVLPGAAETCALFRKLGKKLIFLSNDDTQTRKQKTDRIRKANIQANVDDVFTSSYLAVDYAKMLEVPKDKKIFIIAHKSTEEEFLAEGYTCLPTGPDPLPEDFVRWFHEGEIPNEDVGAVVVGMDVHFGTGKMIKATEYLKNQEVPLIATYQDQYLVRPNGHKMCGPAGLVSAVSTASERLPFLAGKPSLFAFQAVQRQHPDIDPERCLAIGDSLDSEIRLGNSLSMTTLLVLSGVHNLDDVRRAQKNPKLILDVPDYHVPSMETLHELLKHKTG